MKNEKFHSKGFPFHSRISFSEVMDNVDIIHGGSENDPAPTISIVIATTSSVYNRDGRGRMLRLS